MQVKQKETVKKVIVIVLCVLFLALLAYLGTAFQQYKQMTQDWYEPLPQVSGSSFPHNTSILQTPGVPLDQSPNLTAEELYHKEQTLQPFSMMLIGTDSRKGERARSDTLLIATINPITQQAQLISIPRDTYIKIPGKGFDKVNHATAFGGPALLKKTLEDYLSIKIDRYATIDFDGFRKIIDELGGVEVTVKKRMKYTDPSDGTNIDLYPGKQILNGKQALDYARYRKSDVGHEDSDYERIARQQEIIRALANKGGSMDAFLKAFKLMEILGKHIKTDLTQNEISSLLVTYYDPKKNHITTETIRGRDERIWNHSTLGWYYLVSSGERERIQEKIKKVLSAKAEDNQR